MLWVPLCKRSSRASYGRAWSVPLCLTDPCLLEEEQERAQGSDTVSALWKGISPEGEKGVGAKTRRLP